MNLPELDNFDLSAKRVIIRVDIDVPVKADAVEDDSRIKNWLPTVNKTLEKGAREVVLMGHIGRPSEGVKISTEIIKPLVKSLGPRVRLEENLRFNEEEEKNDPVFAKKLASFGDFYVNEAFAASHRAHASIVGLPKLLPHAAGLHFIKEVENLSKVMTTSKKPVIVIISGVKEDKLPYIEAFKKFADRILVGGRLPEYLGDEYADPKVVVARLLPDKEDITLHAVEAFEEEIKKAGTVLVAGPVGKFEEEGHRQATRRVFGAVAKSSAFKVAGGGDTIAAIRLLGLESQFDWLSSGGGAMLEFLSKGTLPGIEALLK